MKLDSFEGVCVRVSELDDGARKKKKERKKEGFKRKHLFTSTPRTSQVKVGSWQANENSVTLVRPCDLVQG